MGVGETVVGKMALTPCSQYYRNFRLGFWEFPLLKINLMSLINKFQPAINCMLISSLWYRKEHTFNGMVESEGTRVPYIPTPLQLYNLHTQSLPLLPATYECSK